MSAAQHSRRRRLADHITDLEPFETNRGDRRTDDDPLDAATRGYCQPLELMPRVPVETRVREGFRDRRQRSHRAPHLVNEDGELLGRGVRRHADRSAILENAHSAVSRSTGSSSPR